MQTTPSTAKFSFIILTVLFFIWGLLTSLNDILVPHLKAVFDLKHWQAQLIQFFFFGAYFLMSIPAGYVIKRLGYKGGIVLGLSLMGLGCLAFYPASIIQQYGVFLIGLFILASGITILQVAANPYVAVLGPENTAASRLNLAQGFNSLGHTIAPLLGALLILQNTDKVDVSTVRLPYVVMSILLFLIAFIFSRLSLPAIQVDASNSRQGFNVWRYPQLYLGAIAIFCYVGAEIAVGSFLVEYLKRDALLSLEMKTAGSYVAFYWGGAMVGRFMGAVSLSNQGNKQKLGLMMVFPLIAFAVSWVASTAYGGDPMLSFGFLAVMMLNFIAFQFGKGIPSRLLSVFALMNILLLVITMNSQGQIALWSILGVGLFNSIMWSNIFTLGIEKLGAFTSIGSSVLIMMIAGGAIIPPLQGLFADMPTVGVKYSFLIPATAYAYLVFYGIKMRKLGEN
jgi:FHS family L-fucose permease-like MFS transporter